VDTVGNSDNIKVTQELILNFVSLFLVWFHKFIVLGH